MSDLRFELIAPGWTMRGKVTWDRRELHPQLVEVLLFWHTVGAGDKDKGAVRRERSAVGAERVPVPGGREVVVVAR